MVIRIFTESKNNEYLIKVKEEEFQKIQSCYEKRMHTLSVVIFLGILTSLSIIFWKIVIPLSVNFERLTQKKHKHNT